MRGRLGWLPAALLLGLLRVLIAWTYERTANPRLAQLLHASSAGFLVILSAPHVTPAQEALWYAIYAAVLWAIVITAVLLLRRVTTPIAARPATHPAVAAR
jgi:hypothetical protein